jgi:hypothetical protein
MLMEASHGGISLSDFEDMSNEEFGNWIEGFLYLQDMKNKKPVDRGLETDAEPQREEAERLQPPPEGWQPLKRSRHGK